MADMMTQEKQIAEKGAEAATEGAQKTVQTVSELSEETPSPLYLIATGASILASAYLFLRKSREWGLFVGQWAPTFLALGLFYKLLKPSKEVSKSAS